MKWFKKPPINTSGRPCVKALSREKPRKPASRSASISTAPALAKIATGIGFFDHMLEQLARHSLIDIELRATGDLHIDQHHTVEDTGIALGQAVRQALGDMAGIARFADVLLPMDETLTRVAVDISGRPFLVFRTKFAQAKIGAFDSELVREFFQAFATHAAMTIHVETLYGENAHHIAEILVQGLGPRLARRGRARSSPKGRDSINQGFAVLLELSKEPQWPFTRFISRGVGPQSVAEAAFVRQAFSWKAFFFGPLWLLRHRLWAGLALWAAAYSILIAASLAVVSAWACLFIALALQMLLGLEANRLREAKLAATRVSSRRNPCGACPRRSGNRFLPPIRSAGRSARGYRVRGARRRRFVRACR